MKNYLILFLLFFSFPAMAQYQEPVTPNASREARALLQFLYSISGKYTLTGQHNFPISGDKNTRFAAEYIGKTPVVWSQDFGFARDGTQDSYLARPAIIAEAIRQHRLGSIITLCWHAVPPTADEPITFQPLPDADSTALASVQGRLLDQQFQDILTPGTELHKKWLAQVDEIAGFLKQLQEAGVPVLWRPYHEMNGDWFWWGGRYEGKFTTARLYQQIFDRMVHHHKLNNLIWMWSVDRPSQPGREFERYYPGNEYLDIVSLDVYGSDFNQTYFDALKTLAQGKPLALGEVGVPPTLEMLATQPDWTLWVVWSGMTRGTHRAQYDSYVKDPRVLFMEDSSYINQITSFREVAGLPPIQLKQAADFTGVWRLNEYESDIEPSDISRVPYKLNMIQVDHMLAVESYTQVEWNDDQVTRQIIKSDGSDMKSTVFNAPRIQNASWSADRVVLTIQSRTTFNAGGNIREVTGRDIWKLARRGKRLIIEQTVDSFRGLSKAILVYDKQE